jgi:hypothetical protein
LRPILILLLSLLWLQPLSAQKFQFGVNTSLILSQIEGDQLRGFNKVGFSYGLVGGYSFNPSNWLVVSLNSSTFGSKKNEEKPSSVNNKILIETQLRTINVLFAYSRRFGDSWDNTKKYRALIGTRIHKTVDHETKVFDAFVTEPISFEDQDFKSTFFSVELGIGAFLRKDLLIDLTYNHVPINILKETKANIVKSAPFYLSVNLSYYFL